MNNSEKNADRFLGFADIYDNARPQMPLYPAEICINYLGYNPENVVDLGCGTGLSTLIWDGKCSKVIGIEPSDDMLSSAKDKENNSISFRKAFSHETGLENNFADIIICSQSFHWMNPTDTLKEVNRILKDDGIFATVDCDWPPVCKSWKAEKAYSELMSKVNRLEIEYEELRNSFSRWEKSKHLENIKSSGFFRYCREIIFSNSEKCTAERFINIALSQGGLQGVLKFNPALINEELENFKIVTLNEFSNNEFSIDFNYRMRIGIK